MNYEPVRRRWFQIHLSTAIVLLFVTGALMWANLRLQTRKKTVGPVEFELGGRKVLQDSIEVDESMLDEKVQTLFMEELCLYSCIFQFRFMGWPATYRISYSDANHYNNITGTRWYQSALALNVLAAFGSQAAIAMGCEWWIRRKRTLTSKTPRPTPVET